MRILLDTNVLVSGCMNPHGPPGQLLDHWRRLAFELVTSEHQVDELVRVLSYEKIRMRIDTDLAADLLERLEAIPMVHTRDLPRLTASPDTDDNLILAAAIAGHASLLVTGDKSDLLDLGNLQGVEIIRARIALDRLKPWEAT